MLEEFTQIAIEQLLTAKNQLITDCIIRKAKIKDFSLKEEKKQRFPRIMCIQNTSDLSEHWYWNDGSPEGLLLIKFFHPRQDAFEGNGIIKIELYYEIMK